MSTSDGVTYMMRIMPYRTARNAIDGLVLTFVDISRLKRAQGDLRHMMEVFREGADPAIIIDLKAKIINLNDQAIRAYGYDRQAMLGKHLGEIIPRGQQEEAEALINRCRDGEGIRNVPWRILSADGEATPVALTLTILSKESGEVDAIAMVTRKLNERAPV